MARHKHGERVLIAYAQGNSELKEKLYATGAFDEIAEGYCILALKKVLFEGLCCEGITLFEGLSPGEIIGEYMSIAAYEPTSEALKAYERYKNEEFWDN